MLLVIWAISEFLIFMNDIPRRSEILSNIPFGDKTNLFSVIKMRIIMQKIMNQKLRNIASWLSANKLSKYFNKKINGQQIEQVKCIQNFWAFI